MASPDPTLRTGKVATGPSGSLSLSALLSIKRQVASLARELGRWAKERSDAHQRGDFDLGTHAKTAPGDVVTEIDVEVQRRLVGALGAAYPTFGMLGEEDLGHAKGTDFSGPTWVIDPIDGTQNFVRDYPGFCVSIGLVDNGESVLGVIYDASTDATFWAVKGGGAWRNDARLHVAADKALDHAVLTTGLTTGSEANPLQQPVFAELTARSAGMRQSGSSCRDLCFAASGKVDLFWQFGIRAWDVAAGIVLVTEAGGIVALSSGPNALQSGALSSNWVGTEKLTIVAGTKRLASHVVSIIQQHGQR